MTDLFTPPAGARPPARARPATSARPLARDPPRDYLSYSAVASYQACPLRYFFRYGAGLPEQTGFVGLVFGGGIHRAAEYHFRELLAGREPPPAEALLSEYEAAWNEYDPAVVDFGKDESQESLFPLARRVLAAFRASPFARPEGDVFGVEVELRGPVVPDCPDLLGRIDLIVETADAIVVSDLKTSRARWTPDQAEESAGQLLLYHELARAFAPHKPLQLQFAVITKTKDPIVELHPVPVDHRRIQRTQRIVQRVWQAIAAQTFYPAPSPLNCSGCPFREPCRAWNG